MENKITLRDWFESCVSFKYLSNFSIIVCVLAYYTNVYWIFFLCIPLIIANLILIVLLEYNDLDTLVKSVFNLENGDARDASDSPNSINCMPKSKLLFVILNTLWHIVPLLWLRYILDKDNLIYIFK